MSRTLLRSESPAFSLDALKALFLEYQNHLGISLCFQDFEGELEQLPGKYAPQKRGQLYLVCWKNLPVGCAGIYEHASGACEVKRVYVQPAYQGKGLGRMLMEAAITDARTLGYRTMILDSLRRLTAARALYETLDFQETAPYNENPHEDVYYMALDLSRVKVISPPD